MPNTEKTARNAGAKATKSGQVSKTNKISKSTNTRTNSGVKQLQKKQNMGIQIGINEKNSQAVAFELSKILADETVLCTKTKNAHWNIEGADFYNQHKFFEAQIVQLDDMIDQVAERIRSLGHYAPATLQSFLNLTQLSEKMDEKNDSQGYIKELVEDHESVIIVLRENIHVFAKEHGDAGSSDFITGLMETHEKMAWFLRSHLKH